MSSISAVSLLHFNARDARTHMTRPVNAATTPRKATSSAAGIRTAHSRSGKYDWIGLSGGRKGFMTKGEGRSASHSRGRHERRRAHGEEGPDSVIGENGHGCCDHHGCMNTKRRERSGVAPSADMAKGLPRLLQLDLVPREEIKRKWATE